MRTPWNRVADAVVARDAAAVRAWLAQDPDLVHGVAPADRLYEKDLFHWIYVGDTCLHLAAAGYRVEIARALLASGADPNACANRRRSTPLHYAADGFINGPAWNETDQVEMLAVLLQSGARLEGADANGATALHRAVRTRCAAAVECLLDNGASPTAKNKTGSTPFHLAVQSTGRGGSGEAAARDAQRRIVASFVQRGVSTRLADGGGLTVLDHARRSWVIELLPPS